MTDDLIKLARRAVACKNWRWMRGMNTTTGDTFIAFSDCDEAYWLAHPDDPCEVEPIAGLLPDLCDPATLGCVLALVREAWGQPEMCCCCSIAPGWGVYLALVREAWGQDDLGAFCYRERWCVETPQEGLHYVYGASEAEALVAALEGAP